MPAELAVPASTVTQGMAPSVAASLSSRHHSDLGDVPSAVAGLDAAAAKPLKRPGLSLAGLEVAAQRAATFVVRGQ